MADRGYGFKEAADDAIAGPTGKCIEEVLKELVMGKRRSSIQIDFADLLETAKEAIESAFSAGLVVAAIRFVLSLIFSESREPAYYVNIQVAKQIYAEYGDSRWRGIKNLWWRFSILNQANVKLIEAQCLAKQEGNEMDVARIVLLRGLLAQAAGVWSEAERHFEKFVLNAQETIKILQGALNKNQEDRSDLENKITLTPYGKALVEKLLGDPRVAAAVSERRIEGLVKIVAPEITSKERTWVGLLTANRVNRSDIEKRIQGLHTFIAYCKYRPTLRDAVDYRIERMQVSICRSHFFRQLTTRQQKSVVRLLAGMRRKHRRPTLENMQKKAPLLIG